jgi:hypothetical protein
MLNPVRSVSGVIVMIDLITIIYDYRITSSVVMATIISPMVIIVVVTINTNCDNSRHSEIGRMVAIIVRRVVRYIGG